MSTLPTVVPMLSYEDGVAAIEFLTEAFGFRERTRREMPAHPVHTAAGRRRRRAEVEPRDRRRVRREDAWARDQLRKVVRSARDVAAGHALVVTFQIGRQAHGAREHSFAEAGGEAF